MSLTSQQQETQAILELVKERDLWKAEAERWRAIRESQACRQRDELADLVNTWHVRGNFVPHYVLDYIKTFKV